MFEDFLTALQNASGQTNAESERSLSVNAESVTAEKSNLNEKTIIGIRAVKELVRFCDPAESKPESIPITPALRNKFRAAHSLYQDRL